MFHDRAVMGSVSNFLTHHCPCPVLILKLEPIEIEARKSLNDKKQVAFNEVLGNYYKIQDAYNGIYANVYFYI
jgi:hypothetical protein